MICPPERTRCHSKIVAGVFRLGRCGNHLSRTLDLIWFWTPNIVREVWLIRDRERHVLKMRQRIQSKIKLKRLCRYLKVSNKTITASSQSLVSINTQARWRVLNLDLFLTQTNQALNRYVSWDQFITTKKRTGNKRLDNFFCPTKSEPSGFVRSWKVKFTQNWVERKVNLQQFVPHPRNHQRRKKARIRTSKGWKKYLRWLGKEAIGPKPPNGTANSNQLACRQTNKFYKLRGQVLMTLMLCPSAGRGKKGGRAVLYRRFALLHKSSRSQKKQLTRITCT